jgi:dCMP deaminase
MQLSGESLLMGSKWDNLLVHDQENEDRDGVFLGDVWRMAEYSQDSNTQVASALVSWTGGLLLAGWNELPTALCNKGYPKSANTKNYCTEHAERRVLYKAVENDIPTKGLQMYGTWIGCSECARAIIQFGITRVVTFRKLVELTPPKWEESVYQGLNMMKDAGITVVGWSGELRPSNKIRFNGELIDKSVIL